MGISQQIGASSLIKPGVIDNTAARPASPYEGQVIFQKDTDLVYLWNGTAWVEVVSALTKAPRGIMTYASVTTSDTAITAEEVQITGSSFTAVTGRLYKVTYVDPDIYSVTATGFYGGRIRSTNISGTIRQEVYVQLPTSGITNAHICAVWIGTLTAGTHNFVATGFSGTATAGAGRSSTQPAFLIVEDIGAA